MTTLTTTSTTGPVRITPLSRCCAAPMHVQLTVDRSTEVQVCDGCGEPTAGAEGVVRALGMPLRRTNAQAIADAARLGYLPGDVLDPTYGEGKFWTIWRPANLVASDLHPSPTRLNIVPCRTADFRHLPYPDGMFGAVTLDGPYKLNGTSTGLGPSASDASYGVRNQPGWQAVHDLIKDGITEAARVTERKGYVLIKCMDQVCGGHKRWQVREFAAHAEDVGLRHVDELLVFGYREQPKTNPDGSERLQQRVHQDYSTLIVCRKGVR